MERNQLMEMNMHSHKMPATTGNALVSNMRGDRAFNIFTGKVLCHEVPFLQRAMALVIAASAIGAFAPAAQGAPVAPAKAKPAVHTVAKPAQPALHFKHRSIWAVKWAAAHPAEEAAYQRKLMSKYARHPYPTRRWAPRGHGAHAWAASNAYSTPYGARHWRKSRYAGHRWTAAVAPAHIQVPAAMSAQSHGASAGGVQVALQTPAPTQIKILPNTRPIASLSPAPKKPADPQRIARAESTRVAENSNNAGEETSPNVTLDFVAADINDVLKSLAMQTHTNIVSGADVKGNVTVSLTNVTLDEALDMITKLSGFSYAKVGHTYVVGTPGSIQSLTTSGSASIAPVTAVLTLTYSDLAQMETSIKDRYPNVKVTPGNTVGGVGAGGVLIVTGTDDDVTGVKALVDASETALAHGMENSRTELYHIKYASAIDLMAVLSRLVPSLLVTPAPTAGFHLSAPSTADSSASSSTSSYGAPPNGSSQGGASTSTSSNGSSTTSTSVVAVKPNVDALLLTGSDADIKRAIGILGEVDYKPAQINYEAKITEINLNATKNLGLNWDFSQATTRIGETTDNLNTTIDKAGPTLGDNGKSGLSNLLKFGTIARTAVSGIANISLDMLFKNGDAKLLSNPNISAVDGQQAAVFIGDTVKYISSITQTTTGQTVTTDSVNVGIKLYVAGKVSDDGYVTVNIHPEVSLISGYLAVPGGGSLPQISSREATTTVRVKDGDYIAIGGLISDQDLKNMNKVPFLGDLPFIGGLFRDQQHNHQRDEVVIFVKVSIQKDAA
jgi:type IV pilus assembly protein PilQ